MPKKELLGKQRMQCLLSNDVSYFVRYLNLVCFSRTYLLLNKYEYLEKGHFFRCIDVTMAFKSITMKSLHKWVRG